MSFRDYNFNFVVNNENVGITDFSNGVHIYVNYPIAFGQTYLVSAGSVREEQLTVKTGIIRNINGTYTDLQARVDATVPGGVLVLPYNFTYDADVDGDNLRQGVNIDKDLVINGNGNVINGNMSAAMLVIDGCNVVLNNIAFVDGVFDKNGGAIYSDGNLTINDCTFTNCLDSDGYVIHNERNLSLSGNTVEGAIYNSGMITSPVTVVFMNDESKTFDAFVDAVVYAKLTDDNGNIIVNRENLIMLSTKAFTNEDVTIFILNKTDNLYYATVTPVKTGLGATSSAALDDAYPDNEVISQIMHVNPTNRTLVVTFDDNITAIDALDVIVNVTRTIDGKPVVATVNVTIGDVTKSVTTGKDGLGTITFDPFKADEYLVNASIAADESYTYTEELNGLTVNKVDSVVAIDSVVAVTYPEDVAVSFNVTLPTTVTYVVKTKDGKVVIENTTIADVGADLVLSGLDAGEYTVTIANSGNENVTGAVDSADFVVNKADSTVVAEDMNLSVGENGTVKYTTTPEGLNVTFKSSDDSVVTVDADGNVIAVGGGNATITVTVGDGKNYALNSTEILVSVTKLDTILTVNNVRTVYNTTRFVVATLTDVNGNILSDVNVKIVVGNLTKIAKTDENGQVSLDISSLEPGEYAIRARSSGVNNIYAESKAFATATVYPEKLDTTLTIPDVYVIGNSSGVVVATLKDDEGNALSDIKVKIVVGNLTVTALTDENGQVSLDISDLAPGVYKISSRSSGVNDLYKEAKAYAKAIVSEDKLDATLTIPDVVIVGDSSGAVVATLTDSDGKAISGVNVKIAVGELSVTAKTDAKGQVSLDVSDLAPGVYKVSARSSGVSKIYKEAKAYAKVIVSEEKLDTTLIVPDVVVDGSSSAVVVATLKDSYNYRVSGVNVKIAVGELTKTAKTDENGQVSLDISSLAPGDYKISARSSGVSDIYNESKATAKATVYAN